MVDAHRSTDHAGSLSMADLRTDTEPELLEPSRYRAQVSRDWQLIGPAGGYLCSMALRAAGHSSKMTRPVSVSCQYLAVPKFAPLELHVAHLQSTRRAEALRVSMVQGSTAILSAVVWSVAADLPGPSKCWAEPAPAPQIEDTKLLELSDVQWRSASLFRQVEVRTIHPAQDGARDGRVRTWTRLLAIG